MKQYIAVDVGGTAIKHSVLYGMRRILCQGETPTEAWKGGASVAEKVMQIIQQYLKHHDEVCGVCISTAGMVDVNTGRIFHSSPLIPGYAGTNYKEMVRDRFGLPCEVENDVNCAGLAEARSGAAKDSSSAVILTVGTGIGGCFIQNGRIWHGFSGSACEVGYMNIDGTEFQKIGATSVLVSKVAKIKQEPPENWNGIRIFEAARNGDSVCISAINEMADALGKGIANICCIVNPEMVVLGGGVMKEKDYMGPRILRSMKQWLPETVFQNTKLGFAEFGNDAGMFGAYCNFKLQRLQK